MEADEQAISEALFVISKALDMKVEDLEGRHYQLPDGTVACGAKVPPFTLWREPLMVAGQVHGSASVVCPACRSVFGEALKAAAAEHDKALGVAVNRTIMRINQLGKTRQAA